MEVPLLSDLVLRWLGADALNVLLNLTHTVLALAVNVLLQSTLLIGAGILLARMLHRRGAPVEASVLRMTLLAVLVCPVASVGLGSLGVGWELIHVPSFHVRAFTPVVRLNSPAATLPSQEPVSGSEAPLAAERTSLPANAPSGRRITHGPLWLDRNIYSWLMEACLSLALAWLVVSAWLLLRLLGAHGWLWLVRRTAARAPSSWEDACHELAVAMDVRPPDLRSSRRVKSPCLVGFRHPVILFPETDNAGDAAAVHDVIVHELAHLSRHDCLWNLIGRLVCAVMFFQPLVWRLTRRLEDLSDDVADDYVVQYGRDRHQYAHQLVDIAERYRPARSEVMAGAGVIAFKSSLGRRVQRILDSTRAVTLRTGRRVLMAIMLVGVCATLAAGLIGGGAVTKAASRVPEAELMGHAYARIGDPVYLNLACPKAGLKMPPDAQCPDMYLRIDGVESQCSLGLFPFWESGGATTFEASVGGQKPLKLAPGRHRIACVFRNFDVTDVNDPAHVVHFDEYVSKEFVFEVVERLPDNYYEPLGGEVGIPGVEEGWEEQLRKALVLPATYKAETDGEAVPSVNLVIDPLPFDLAFKVYAQAEGSEERLPVGVVAARAGVARYVSSLAAREGDRAAFSLDALRTKRWRFILIPSQRVALENPPIHQFYGRECVTDWMTLEPDPVSLFIPRQGVGKEFDKGGFRVVRADAVVQETSGQGTEFRGNVQLELRAKEPGTEPVRIRADHVQFLTPNTPKPSKHVLFDGHIDAEFPQPPTRMVRADNGDWDMEARRIVFTGNASLSNLETTGLRAEQIIYDFSMDKFELSEAKADAINLGSWVTLAVSAGPKESMTGLRGASGVQSVKFSAAESDGNYTRVVVSDTIGRGRFRVIAVDTDGRVHEPVDTDVTGADTKTRRTLLRFAALPPQHVKEFRFQIWNESRLQSGSDGRNADPGNEAQPDRNANAPTQAAPSPNGPLHYDGRVLDSSAKPVAGATVVLCPDINTSLSQLTNLVSVTTDSEGRFEISGSGETGMPLPYPSRGLRIGANGLATVIVEHLPDSMHDVNVTMSSLSRLGGRVTAPDQGHFVALANQRVVLEEVDLLFFNTPLETRTDAQGRFEFANLSSDTLSWDGASLRPLSKTWEISSGDRKAYILLNAGEMRDDIELVLAESGQAAEGGPRVEPDPAWGAGTEGLLCRVRTPRTTWKSDGPIVLRWDIRNEGSVSFDQEALLDTTVEFDGREYRPAGRMGTTQWGPLRPGEQVLGRAVFVDTHWSDGTTPLQLKPGTHRVSLVCKTSIVDPDAPRVGGKPITAVSQPLDIEVVAGTLADEGGGATAKPAPWRAAFDKVYRLDDGQDLRRIAPPFIPERKEYYLFSRSPAQQQGNSDPPDSYVFDWAMRAQDDSEFFNCAGPTPLSNVLGRVIDLTRDQFAGPEELLFIDVPGDWVRRKGVDKGVLLKALEGILKKEIGRDLRFVQAYVERDAIIASGKFAFTPLPDVDDQEAVHMLGDQYRADGGSGGCRDASVATMLRYLADDTGQPVIDQTKSTETIIKHLRYHPLRALEDPKAAPEEGTRLRDLLLQNLTKQTGLEFNIERRTVPVWFVRKG